MKIIDLCHEIHENMTVFAGTEKPSIQRKYTVEKNGYALHEIAINSHTGTHIDAPAHMIAGGKFLDDYPLEHFTGKAFIIDVNKFAGKEIPTSYLKEFTDEIQNTEFLILNSGWHKHWQRVDYHSNYPVLSLEAAQWLTTFNLRGIGLDYISIDPVESQNVPLHKIILGAGMLIIENLTNLGSLPKQEFHIQCFPLKIAQADGSTSRVLAFVD
ncbi:MAG: cyclase family protein [Bacteroidales bacterium]|nr:cyclase family protein [Bacteroidales bacterium]